MRTTTRHRTDGAEWRPTHHAAAALAGGNGLAYLLRERRRLLRRHGLTRFGSIVSPFTSLRQRQRLAAG